MPEGVGEEKNKSFVKVRSPFTNIQINCKLRYFTLQMSHLYSGASFVSHIMITSGEEARKNGKKTSQTSKLKQSQAQKNKNYVASKNKSYFSFWTKKK